MPTLNYTCTCPDYQHRRPSNLMSQGIASALDSSWQAQYPVDPEFRCKHIWATIISNDEDIAPPNDAPLPADSPGGKKRMGWIGNQSESFYIDREIPPTDPIKYS